MSLPNPEPMILIRLCVENGTVPAPEECALRMPGSLLFPECMPSSFAHFPARLQINHDNCDFCDNKVSFLCDLLPHAAERRGFKTLRVSFRSIACQPGGFNYV